jgi:hypothetical protein
MLFAAAPASTAELNPLSEVLSGEDSPAMAVYAFTICAGLCIILAAILHDAAPDHNPKGLVIYGIHNPNPR